MEVRLSNGLGTHSSAIHLPFNGGKVGKLETEVISLSVMGGIDRTWRFLQQLIFSGEASFDDEEIGGRLSVRRRINIDLKFFLLNESWVGRTIWSRGI